MRGRCFCTMASFISSMVPSPSDFGRLIWMRPDLMILGIIFDCLLTLEMNVTMAFQELTVPFIHLAFTLVDGYFPSQQDRLDLSRQLPSFVGRVIYVHVVAGGRKGMLTIGIHQ